MCFPLFSCLFVARSARRGGLIRGTTFYVSKCPSFMVYFGLLESSVCHVLPVSFVCGISTTLSHLFAECSVARVSCVMAACSVKVVLGCHKFWVGPFHWDSHIFLGGSVLPGVRGDRDPCLPKGTWG